MRAVGYCICWPPLIEILAGHEYCFIACKVGHWAGHFLGLPKPAHGYLGMIFDSSTSFGIAVTIFVPI